MIETAVRRLCGQSSTGPTGVADQSKARVRSPISPPPPRPFRLASGARETPSATAVACPWPTLRGRSDIILPLAPHERERKGLLLSELRPQGVDLLLQVDHPQLPSDRDGVEAFELVVACQ